MHKFTIFTIFLSTVVVLVVADLVVSDYWGDDFADETQLVEEVVEPTEEVVDPEMRGDEEDVALDSEATVGEEVTGEELVTEETVEEPTTSEATDTVTPLVSQLSLLEPVVETGDYEGMIYGFWDTSTDFADFTVYRHKIFDGTDYVGTVYEVQTGSEIQTFGAYEILRQLASTSESGSINENNSYGEASFYFNHATKTNTVFLTLQENNIVYAFEYSHAYHSNMRTLIELL